MSAPPPPPPPPPPPVAKNTSPAVGNASSALFAEIRAGGDGIASRLRHVTDDQKSYKQNIQHGAIDMSALELRKAEVEARRLAEESGGRLATVGAVGKETPVIMLADGKCWVVKHHLGTPQEQLSLSVAEATMRQAVRIENCQFAHITVDEKVNSVSIINCRRVQVALQSVVSAVQIVSCEQVDMQVATALPTVCIEKSVSVNIYLMDKEEARNVEIVTACSSAVNVNFRGEQDDDDVVERAVPEQFVSKIVSDGNGRYHLITKPNDTC